MSKLRIAIVPAVIATALIAATLPLPSANAWTDTKISVSTFGGSAAADTAKSVTLDGSGNIYTTGNFSGTADFDPGAGVVNLTSAGGSDVFITKFDSTGNFLWAKNFGGTLSDIGYSIKTDLNGNIFIGGTFNDTADFDPGAGVASFTPAGGSDAFIVKLDSSGNYLWARTYGGTSSDEIFSIAVDSNGAVYGNGYFRSTVDFDPGAGVVSRTAAGNADIVIWKLDALGNFVWVKTLGGTSSDSGNSITLDNSGNIYTTGYFMGTGDFDPGAGVANLTSKGSYDAYICKLDSTGNLVWAGNIGGTTSDGGSSITVDASGNVYITGDYSGTADFDPGAGATSITTSGNSDAFIAKLDATGNFVWAKSFGGTLFDYGIALGVDAGGNVYVTGQFTGTVDFDPNAGVTNLTSVSSSQDFYVSKFDFTGALLWAEKIGDSGYDESNALVVDSGGNVYIAGSFQRTVDFDPNAGVANLTSVGLGDPYVLKLNSSGIALLATTPSSPTLTSVTGGDRQITINFTAGSDGGASIIDYKYSLNGGSFVSAATTSSPITVTGLATNTSYSVRLLAQNSAGEGTISSAISATTARSAAEVEAAATAAAKAAAEAAAAKREAEKRDARAEIVRKAINKQTLSTDLFDKAEIPGITAGNRAGAEAEIHSLPDASRSEINQIMKIARKYEVVGLIGSDRVKSVYPSQYIEIGLISADSKIKSTLVNAVSGLAENQRNSYEEIKAAIEAKTAELQARKDRLAKVLARSFNRGRE